MTDGSGHLVYGFCGAAAAGSGQLHSVGEVPLSLPPLHLHEHELEV